MAHNNSLDYLSSVFEIQQTLSLFALSASRRDWELLVSTFAPDGTWAAPGIGVRLAGHEELRRGLPSFTTALDYFIQVNAPALISVNGDTAVAESVIRESGKYTNRDEGMDVQGIYNDKLVLTVNGWKFSERVFQVLGMYNFPLSVPKR